MILTLYKTESKNTYVSIHLSKHLNYNALNHQNYKFMLILIIMMKPMIKLNLNSSYFKIDMYNIFTFYTVDA